jgi:hypothetical protein
MPRNYKFHAIALSTICALIIGLYVAMMPPAPPPTADNGGANDRFIQIDSATWGIGCNPYIAKELQDRQFKPVQRDQKGDIVAQKPIALVEANNVLPIISAACDGKPKCEILATSSSLGVEPMASCSKQLKVGYRCFSYDRLHLVDISQSNTLKIDCDEANASEGQ